ncbi:MAG: hypothetical protein M1269_13190 [Chloroflexi bacterium]|nr:hypothetical protein [Chloroflexota bacterium]
MRPVPKNEGFDTLKGFALAAAFAATFLSAMIGTIMLRFSSRPDIVPTGPMGMMDDPHSYNMGLLLIFCSAIFFIGLILSKNRFAYYGITGAGVISIIPLTWGWLYATAIYLERIVVLMGFGASVLSIVFAVAYILRRQ